MVAEAARILVVDDSPEMCRLVSGILEREGHRVATAASGLEAIRVLKDGARHDLVTLDIEMPTLSGIETLRVLKGIDPGCAFVMVSGQSSMHDAITAMRQGAYDYVIKPFEEEELLFAVRRVLAHRALERENRLLVEQLREINANLEALVHARTRELEDAYARLREIDGLKSRFISLASHELVTPVAILRAAGDVVAHELQGDPRRARIVQVMEDTLERLTRIVGEITDVAQLQERRAVFTFAPVGIAPLIEGIVGSVRPILEHRRLRVEVDLPPGLPPVHADARRAGQVIENLLTNAIRFTPDGGAIGVAARVPADAPRFLELTVTDTGVGIDAGQLERIFETFSGRGAVEHHHSGTTQFGSAGMGLGLSLVREIVSEHRGRVWAESPCPGSDRGSRFHVLLPLAGQEPAAGRPAPA